MAAAEPTLAAGGADFPLVVGVHPHGQELALLAESIMVHLLPVEVAVTASALELEVGHDRVDDA